MVRVVMHFWGEAIDIACHIVNRIYLRPKTNKISYGIWKGKKPIVKYFRVFGSKFYIIRDKESSNKFDSKSNEGTFIEYSKNSKGHHVYNFHT